MLQAFACCGKQTCSDPSLSPRLAEQSTAEQLPTRLLLLAISNQVSREPFSVLLALVRSPGLLPVHQLGPTTQGREIIDT